MPYSKVPHTDEYAPYYEKYISKVKDTKDIFAQLKKQQTLVMDLLNSFKENQLDETYQEGKWTIKQLLLHVIDTERIFSYRALCIARGETISLPGYDQDLYAEKSLISSKTKAQLKEEYDTNRRATIALFRGFDDAVPEYVGTANNQKISVRAILFILAGHELHHLQVLKERYL